MITCRDGKFKVEAQKGRAVPSKVGTLGVIVLEEDAGLNNREIVLKNGGYGRTKLLVDV